MNYYNQYNLSQNNVQPGSPFSGAPAEAVLEEKYRLRRLGNAIGGGLLIFLALPYLISAALPYIAEAFGVEIIYFYYYLDQVPGSWIYQNVMSVAVFTLPFILAAYFYGQRPTRTLMMGASKKGLTLPLVLIGFGGCAVANLMAGMFETVIGYTENTAEDILGAFPTDFFGVALVVVSVCFVPALVEEFAFRGIVLGLLRNVSEPFAIFTSALLFGLMHSNLSQIPSAFLLGLVLGAATVCTKSIWPACLIHMLNNAVSVGMTYAVNCMDEESMMVCNVGLYIIMMALGVLGFILFVKKDRDALSFPKKENTLPGFKKFTAFLLTPCMIFAVVGMLLSAVILELMLAGGWA